MPKRVLSQSPTAKNPAAVALSKLGASKGEKTRAEKLSAKQRSEIARNAVLARWRNLRKPSGMNKSVWFGYVIQHAGANK